MKTKRQGKGTFQTLKTEDRSYLETLKERHKSEGILLATNRAKEDAAKNLPTPKSKSPALLMFLTAFYNTLVTDFKSHAQNSLQKYHAGKDIQEHKRKVDGLKDKLNQVVNGLRVKRRAIDDYKSHEDEMQQYYRAMFGVLLLTTSEMLFAISAFQMFIPNLILSVLVGITFAVAMYYSSVVSARVLKNAKNRVQFILIAATIVLSLSIVFYALGTIRLEYIKEMSEDGLDSELSPYMFMAIQLFFFITSIFLKYFYTPSKEVFEKYRAYKKACTEIKKLEKEEKALERSIEDEEQTLKDSLIGRKLLIEFSADVERRIVAMYHEAYQHYLKQNIHLRTDNSIPVLFEMEQILPPLTLYFQDEKLLDFDA